MTPSNTDPWDYINFWPEDAPGTIKEAEQLEFAAKREGKTITYDCPQCKKSIVTGDGHIAFGVCRAMGLTGPNGKLPEEIMRIDAAARLGSKSKRLWCPRCGENYLAGKGHLGSDYCLVKATVAEQARQGFVRCSTWAWTRKLLPRSNVEMRELPGRLEYRPGRYRGVEARNSIFVPRWSLRVLRGTEGVEPAQRVALLRALQMPVLSHVFKYVMESIEIPRELLRVATADEYETADLLAEHYAAIERRERTNNA